MKLGFIVTGTLLMALAISCGKPQSMQGTTPLASPEQTVSTKPTYKLNNGEPLDEKMAIAAAEKFIADNGYTDLPPMKDKSGLAHESIEWTNDVDELLKQRHDSLERKAFAISKHGRTGSGWTVGFRYKGGGDKTGRAVTMDVNGGNIRMQHQDVFLQKLDKKLIT
jgi:hypothetical protein